MAARPLRVLRLGLIPWKDALSVQMKFVKQLEENPNAKDVLLLCQHPPVYTLGKRQEENIVEANRLRSLGADYFKTNRGGQITFHGPGQLVGYPILMLSRYNKSIKGFVNSLEESLISTVAHWGLVGEHSEHTGVWVNDNKICAFGLQVSHGITFHGFALNCNVDLKWFQSIVACGIVGKGVTSISAELGRDEEDRGGKARVITVDDAIPIFVQKFAQEFNCDAKFEDFEHSDNACN